MYNIQSRFYIWGDDIPELSVMKLVGLPTCPQDALEINLYLLAIEWKGAARDVISINESTRKMDVISLH
jgi:3-deoxy-D-manno-octulosonate 8-phosphate phosphatase (KDO 8-P phosphatase)